MNPVRDDYATASGSRCAICGAEITGRADKQWCSTTCRQRAWRAARAIPTTPTVTVRADTVYACPACDTRYIGEQRCPECNLSCRRLGPGGPCPHCYEAVAVDDIVPAERSATRPPVPPIQEPAPRTGPEPVMTVTA